MVNFKGGVPVRKGRLEAGDKQEAHPSEYEDMELLRAIEARYMQEGFLVREVSTAGRAGRYTADTNLVSSNTSTRWTSSCFG